MIDSRIARRLPPAFAQRAKDFYAEGAPPAPVRRAATVILLRDISQAPGIIGGIQVYMLQRASSMAFAGGLYAFPGGRVDESDIDVHSAALREVEEETGLQLVELYAWSRWVTPEFEPRRYDTWFYVARCYEGAEPRDISGETSWAGWVEPADAMRQYGKQMLPPTAVTLWQLGMHLTVDSVLTEAEDRDLAPITPRPVFEGDSVRLALPGDEGYN